MFYVLFENLKLIAYAAIIFVLAYGANICFSLWYNIKILKESFSWKKLGTSLLKVMAVVIGIVLLCSAVTLLPYVLSSVGLEIGESTEKFIDIMTIITAIVVTCTKYIKEAYYTFVSILNSEMTEENKTEGTAKIGFTDNESEE